MLDFKCQCTSIAIASRSLESAATFDRLNRGTPGNASLGEELRDFGIGSTQARCHNRGPRPKPPQIPAGTNHMVNITLSPLLPEIMQ